MKALSVPAKIYVSSVILLGIILLAWNIYLYRVSNIGLLAVLAIAASLSLVFKVEGSTNRSHYSINFLVYACTYILLGPYATALVIVLSNIAEWVVHKYPWYIQLFNIASYLVTLTITDSMYRFVDPEGMVFSLPGVGGILLAMGVFTLINHLLVGIVLSLARGENFAKSGIFNFFPLMLDYILLCMGAAVALVWMVSPYAIVLILLPLYLIYTTLKVPALERQSETDAKTGLFNARYFERALHTELRRANRFDRPLTVVMADLDLLRNINNTYGHLAGDQVLIGVANLLRTNLRDYDVVSRFGGEEYAIMMPETTPEEAFPRIDAIRQAIENAEFSVPTSVAPIRATMSFGISGRISYENTAQELVHNADAALYHAKLKGRNGTFIYSEDGFVNLFLTESGKITDREAAQSEGRGFGRIPYDYAPSPLRSIPALVTSNKPEQDELERKKSNKQSQMVNIYIFLLFLVSLGLFALINRTVLDVDWVVLAVFAGMVGLTEFLALDIYARDTAVSTSAAPLLAGILLTGPAGAVILSLAFALVALIKHRSPINRLIFNFSNQLIASLLYVGLIQASGSNFLDLSAGQQFVITMAAVGIVYLVTTILVGYGMSLDFEERFKEVWLEKFSWLAPYYLAMGLIAYALLFSYQASGVFGTIVILVPLLLLRFSQMQYLDRTREIVKELKSKNAALESSTDEINKLNNGLLDTLAEVVDLRAPDVLGHSQQVAKYSWMIAKRLGLPARQVELIRKAGLLHDIGKFGVPETILFKPGPLTPGEYDAVKRHVTFGAEILQKSYALRKLVPIILHHHEHFDGRGYPSGISGNQIPIEARIICLADAVEAMSSDRVYRRAMTTGEILVELRKKAGSQFDPLVVDTLVKLVEEEGAQIIENLSAAQQLNKPAEQAKTQPQPLVSS